MYNYYEVKPLHVMLPRPSSYVKRYDAETKWLHFLIKDDDLLERRNNIWDKVSADIKKEFNSELVKKFSKLKYNLVVMKLRIL